MGENIHTPTLAIVMATLALAMTSYGVAILIEQQAHITRINKTLRSLCGPNAPGHHTRACAELSLPLDVPISPFNVLRPDPREK